MWLCQVRMHIQLSFIYVSYNFRRLRVGEWSFGYGRIIHQKIALDELYRMMYDTTIFRTSVHVNEATRTFFVYLTVYSQMRSQTWRTHIWQIHAFDNLINYLSWHLT